MVWHSSLETSQTEIWVKLRQEFQLSTWTIMRNSRYFTPGWDWFVSTLHSCWSSMNREAYSILVYVSEIKLSRICRTVTCYCILITFLSVRPRSRHANFEFHFLFFKRIHTKNFSESEIWFIYKICYKQQQTMFLRFSSSIILFLIPHLFKFSRKEKVLGLPSGGSVLFILIIISRAPHRRDIFWARKLHHI